MTKGKGPLRVLHLRDSPWIDGPGRTILETATHIDRARIDYHVGIFVPAFGAIHPLLESMRQRGLPVHEIVDEGSSLREVAQRVVEIIDALQIEILHTSEFRSNVIGLLCRRGRSVRLISTAHGWIANDLRGKVKAFLDRALRRRFDRVILVSRAMRRQLPRWWVPDSRVCVLHNALVLDQYCPASSRATTQIRDAAREIRLLNVGRLSTEKGQRLLLRAVAVLAPSHPELHLSFAGIGPLEPELRRLARELGIANRVSFTGYVDDMQELYSRTELVVQCSFTEGLPNVILEAAYLGVPIVATDVGGTSEVIVHGESGWLIRPGSVKELVNGIRQFLEQPARFAVMADAAKAKIENEFSFETRTAKQMCIYEELGETQA